LGKINKASAIVWPRIWQHSVILTHDFLKNFYKIGNMQKRRWITAALILVVTGSFSYGQQKNKRNVKLAQTWIQYLISGDADALSKLCVDSAQIQSPNWTSSKRGGSAFGEIYSRYFTKSPDLRHSVRGLFTNQNTIVIEYVSSGTRVGYGKMTGQPYNFDQVAFLQQAGFLDRH
jgi:hypothetical protein